MTIEQIIDIPANHRITLEVPRAIPEGKTILSFTPVSDVAVNSPSTDSPRTIEEALQVAKAKAADPNRKPFSRHYGTLKGMWEGDEVAYQRKLRDEWD
jgi:hypothetical protein